MPENIKALIVVSFLATIVFFYARKLSGEFCQDSDFARRRNLWFALTLAVFLSGNIWLYIVVLAALTMLARTRESNYIAMFFVLLFVAPQFQAQIPGFGLINSLMSLSHQRVLALVIFLPLFLRLITRQDLTPFGRTLPDKLISAYLILVIILNFRDTTFTNALRETVYYFTDIFLPYYVISRAVENVQHFRETLFSLVLAVMVLALIGVFESIKNWYLYFSAMDLLGINTGAYRGRIGLLRAQATVSVIPLGYLMAIGIGLMFFLRNSIPSKTDRLLSFFLLIAGLLAAVSRGPWVGAVFLWLVFTITGPRPLRKIMALGFLGVMALPLLFVLPGGERVINILPFVGASEQNNVSYRERLLENSLIVINRNPAFGSVNYLETPEMEAMRQGQGIIDIVNTYLQVALHSGYVGLVLFVCFFLSVCWGVFRSLKRISDKNSEEYLLGRSLLATMAGVMLIIFTVSSVSIIPIMYWSIAAFGAAYIHMIQKLPRQLDTS